LLATDHHERRVVRVRLERPGLETVASAVERPGQAPVVQDGSAFRGGFEILGGSVAVHPQGGIVVADQGNHRIRWIREGTVTTLAGTGAPGFDGDLDGAGQEWPAAQVPKPPKERLQLVLVGCAKDEGTAGLPGLPLRLQVAELGPLLVGGEKEQGLALQAWVAGAFIRHAAEAWNLPLPRVLEGNPEGGETQRMAVTSDADARQQ
jgi:hypothetical protein